MPYIKYFYNEFPKSKYLFSKDGEKVRYEYYREYYHQPLIKKLKLNDYGVNSFRHTAASKMKMAGLDDKAIEDMMGHTDINFTKKQYIDINAKFLHEQMEKDEIKKCRVFVSCLLLIVYNSTANSTLTLFIQVTFKSLILLGFSRAYEQTRTADLFITNEVSM